VSLRLVDFCWGQLGRISAWDGLSWLSWPTRPSFWSGLAEFWSGPT